MLAVSLVILVLCQMAFSASRASSRSVSDMARSIVARNASKEFTMRYHRTIKQITIAAMRRQKISDTFLRGQRRLLRRSSRASRSA